MKKRLSFVSVAACVLCAALLIGCQAPKSAGVPEEADNSPAEAIMQESSAEKSEETASAEVEEQEEVLLTQEESSQAEIQESDSSEISEISAEEENPAPSVIGTDTGSETQVVIAVTNGLNIAIQSIQFGEPFEDYRSDNLLPEGAVLAAGETKTMYFDPQTAMGAVDYNVYLVFEDGTTATLHSFPYDNMDAVTILDSGSVIYIEYISLKSGEERSS